MCEHFMENNFLQPIIVRLGGLTALDIVEEILLVILLPKWQADVKGLYQA
jgi:hypothetical protein